MKMTTEQFEELLKQAYTRAHGSAHQSALRGVLGYLKKKKDENKKVTSSEKDSILLVLEKAMGKKAMQRLLFKSVLRLTEGLYKEAKQSALPLEEMHNDVDIGFNKADRHALNIIQKGSMYWVGNSWNSYTKNLFDKALEDYFEKGMTRAQLAERFANDFAGLGNRGQHYWTMLADHTATKTRELGRVAAYEDAEIESVRIRAHLSETTTDICRKMHDTVIAVSALSKQKKDYLKAIEQRNMPASNAAWRMFKDEKELNEALERGDNVGLPPYHFKCRTVTVAES